MKVKREESFHDCVSTLIVSEEVKSKASALVLLEMDFFLFFPAILNLRYDIRFQQEFYNFCTLNMIYMRVTIICLMQLV